MGNATSNPRQALPHASHCDTVLVPSARIGARSLCHLLTGKGTAAWNGLLLRVAGDRLSPGYRTLVASFIRLP